MSKIAYGIEIGGEIYEFTSSSGVTSGVVQTMIDESISGKADVSEVEAISAEVQTISAATSDDVTSGEVETMIAAAVSVLEAADSVISGAVDNLSSDLAQEAQRASSAETALDTKINGKQNQLTAGTGISIENDVISVTATSPTVDAYTKAETNALLAQKQNNLTAGTGISIQNDVISVTATSPTVDAYTKAESDAKFATITNFNSHSGNTNVHVTASEKSTWNNKSDFSGNYNDLTNKPTIPAEQIQSDWNQTNTASKDFIKNKPTIPSIWTGTKAQYDAIGIKDPNTIYLIQE